MHMVERAAIFAESDEIGPMDFGIAEAEPALGDAKPGGPVEANPSGRVGSAEPMLVSSAVKQVEDQLIRQAMTQFNGNKKRVATELGISRSYLYKKLSRMGLSAGGED